MTNYKPGLPAELAGSAMSLFPGGALLEGSTAKLVQMGLDAWARRNSPALEAAERASGLSRDDMAEVLERNPDVVPIAARVLFQAGMTNQDEMLGALGAMLGALFLTPNDTDEVELLIISLSDMRRVHLQVLRALEGRPRSYKSLEHARIIQGHRERDELHGAPEDDGPSSSDGQTWNDVALAFDTGLPLTRVQLALAGLQSGGFLSTPTVTGGPGYLLAPAGRTVLEVLRRYQEMSPVDRPARPT